MSSAQTQIAVAANTSSLTNPPQILKELVEDPVPRQNNLNKQRASAKGKHLTRSHAMKESTSPPRTPTPRSLDVQSSVSPSHSSDRNSVRSQSPLYESQRQASPSSPNINIATQMDLDFPKLSPPKSKVTKNNNNNHSNNNSMSNTNEINADSQSKTTIDSDHERKQKDSCATSEPTPCDNQEKGKGTSSSDMDKKNTEKPDNNMNLAINIQTDKSEGATSPTATGGGSVEFSDKSPRTTPVPSQHRHDEQSNNTERFRMNNRKHRNGGNTKNSRPRLKNANSSSVEDGSFDYYTDQSGVELIPFFRDTLNKNTIDRQTLLGIEKELLSLAQGKSRGMFKFPYMCSYERMLVHRVAAYFGMDHNLDNSQSAVVVSVAPTTRIPDIRFRQLINQNNSDEPRKSILKREIHSFEDYPNDLLQCPERGMLDRQVRSFDDRDDHYDKSKDRMYNMMQRNNDHDWSYGQRDGRQDNGKNKMHNNRLLKVQSLSVDNRSDSRPNVSKAHSFGGYGGPQNNTLSRGDSMNSTKSAGGRYYSKQDSVGSTHTPWRLSPSSSGYKTQTQSIRSDSITPSPTGYGSGDHTPEPSVIQSPPTACGVVWAVTDMASVPKGSVLIDPQTLQPIVNQDGSIYHFDPSNLPQSQGGGMNYNSNKSATMQRKKHDKPKSLRVHNNHRGSGDIPESVENEVINETSVIDTTGGGDDIVSPTMNSTQETEGIIQEYGYTKETIPNYETNSDENASPLEEEDQQVTMNTVNSVNQSSISPVTVDDPSTEQANVQNADICDSSNQPNQVMGNCSASSVDSNETNANVVTSSSDTTKKSTEIKVASNPPPNPIMSYATPVFAPVENSTIFTAPPSGPITGSQYPGTPDGNIYAVPQPMVYAYPQPLESEMSGFYMPVFEQAQYAANRDMSNGAIFQPSPNGATSAVVPFAYPYSNPPIYQSPLIYAPDQFNGAATAGPPVQQYPITYPVSYPLPYNGYWTPAMTYYVTPPTATVPTNQGGGPGAPTAILHQSATTAPLSNTIITQQPHTPAVIPSSNGKRGTPPQNQGTAATLVQQAPGNAFSAVAPFAPGMQLQIADPNLSAMYTIHPPIYPNMLPYSTTASSGVISQLPPPPQQLNTVVTHPTMVQTPPHKSSAESSPLINSSNYSSFNPAAGATVMNPGCGTAGGTPQSTPSTPLSIPLPLPHQKNGPVFATPIVTGMPPPHPVNPCYPNNDNTVYNNSVYDSRKQQVHRKGNVASSNNGGGKQLQHHQQHHQQGTQAVGSQTISSQTHHHHQQQQQQQQPNHAQQSQMQQSHHHHNQQTQYFNNNYKKSYDNSSNNGANRNGPAMMNQSQTKRNNESNYHNKTGHSSHQMNQQQTHVTGANSNPGGISNVGINSTHNSGMDNKQRGPRPKPANLDLRRNNANNRNTPSTNSTESNNSPNSITSASDKQSMYMTRGTHIPPMHHGANPIDCPPTIINGYNPSMYVKFGQPYFAHPQMAMPNNNRKSPPHDGRPPLAPLAGMYPVMFPSHRPVPPRTSQSNSNYKGNRLR